MSAPLNPKASSSFLWPCFLALVLILGLWVAFKPQILSFLLGLTNLELQVLGEAKPPSLILLNQTSSSKLEVEPVLEHFHQASKPWAWMTLGFGLILGVVVLKPSVRERYSHKHDLKSLLHHQLKSYPSLAPIVHWERNLLLEPLDRGPWRVALKPLEWVAKHKLLLDSSKEPIDPSLIFNEQGQPNLSSPILQGQIKVSLDLVKSRDLLAKQLGPNFEGFYSLPNYLKALSCAFMHFALGQKETANTILARMSLSFRPPKKGQSFKIRGKPPYLIFPSQAKPNYQLDCHLELEAKELKALWEHPLIQKKILPHNNYQNLVILALYELAKEKTNFAGVELGSFALVGEALRGLQEALYAEGWLQEMAPITSL